MRKFIRSSLPSVNDYGFNLILARELNSHVSNQDIFIPFSTNRNSPNILTIFALAHKLNIRTMELTGISGGQLKSLSSCIHILSTRTRTERIQEGHILYGLVENLYFQKEKLK